MSICSSITLSVVVPCHNEATNIDYFYRELSNAFLSISERCLDMRFETIFVDDGSTDRTINLIQGLSNDNLKAEIKWISFSRNFGKEAAILAGLESSTGNYVALMDADLQDPPDLLPQMFEYLLHEPYDCVATRRITRRGEPLIRSSFSRLFYVLINSFSEVEIKDGARDYRLMTRQMVDSVLKLSEHNRFSKGIFSWVGYQTKWLEYDNIERQSGKSKWGFFSLLKYAIEGITSFSSAPLSVASFVGTTCCLFAVIGFIVVVVRACLFGDPVAGWPSTVSIILLLGGLQLLFLGILGQYLAKTYLETKQRPQYIVKSMGSNYDNWKN